MARKGGKKSKSSSSFALSSGKSGVMRVKSTASSKSLKTLKSTDSLRSSSTESVKSSSEILYPRPRPDHPLGKWVDLVLEYAEFKGIMDRRPEAQTGLARDYLSLTSSESSLLELCDAIQHVFAKERRVLRLNSPAVVIADLHGNLHDLLIYHRLFFEPRSGEYDHIFLFTGDYVDRGPCSAEVIIFLWAMKLVYPDRFFMLRGNHEVESVNKAYTFATECQTKFGKWHTNMYNRFNRVFDHMPLTAIIDERVFCCHGGIPATHDPNHPVLVQELESMPCPLRHPDSEFPRAWEILWNDPMESDEFEEIIDKIVAVSGPDAVTSTMEAGFTYNFKRFTAYYFNEDALRSFLRANHLSALIRGHELRKHGIAVKLNGLCYSLFSTSKYSKNNFAGVIVIENNKIHPRKMDTDTIPL